MPRAFLKYICRGLRGLPQAYKSQRHHLTGECAQLFAAIASCIEDSPLSINEFEKLLTGVDNYVKAAYTGSGFADADRGLPELEILVTGKIPEVLLPAVANVINYVIPATRSEVDRMALYKYDYSWLGVSDDKRTEKYRRTHEVDVQKKALVRKEGPGPMRRCVRCCEISEDMAPPKGYPSWLSSLASKFCICGSMWSMTEREDSYSLQG